MHGSPHHQALGEVEEIRTTQACKSEVFGGTWRRRCLEFVGRVYGYKYAGSYTAHNH